MKMAHCWSDFSPRRCAHHVCTASNYFESAMVHTGLAHKVDTHASKALEVPTMLYIFSTIGKIE